MWFVNNDNNDNNFRLLFVGQYGSEYEYDNKALAYLLKGVCLRIMKSPLHAEECLKNVLSMEKRIKEDRFLVPYAHVELAFLYKSKGNLEKAAHFLDIAKYVVVNTDAISWVFFFLFRRLGHLIDFPNQHSSRGVFSGKITPVIR